MKTFYRTVTRGWAALCLLYLAHPAGAADLVSPVTPELRPVETEQGWTFAVAPYFWGAGLSGDVAQFGLPTVEVDSDFSDILKNLDFAAMAVAEARYDRYSIFGDLMYVKISAGNGTPRGVLATSVDLTSQTFSGLVGAGYSVFQSDAGHLDFVGAMRVWSVNTDLDFHGGILDGVSASDGKTWVDGLVGVRANYSLTPEVYLTGWGMVGAGGANVDWDVAGALGYRFNDRFSAVAGYRALGVNYRNDGFVFDVIQQGPIMGLVMRF
ncbi:hypothetical protein B5V01_11175 [Mesorhizobium erdmanii]|uniref:Outer membrane protein beta-barrel domain-containing protein n=2 Tax=Mesorhizobium TaxID=68287 RepID=A0A3M9XDM0_9HYPH|nr:MULTISPECIES: hypothetical protein [Mesorhizobium]RNJ45842.1 hypothetical protein DNR46_10320 [Mesorhizobium japonicum]RXT47151.1 hypothetical protein B5V01_11175 [Mesorhizobium erdmanii]